MPTQSRHPFLEDLHVAASRALLCALVLDVVFVRGGRAATGALVRLDWPLLRWLEDVGARTEGVITTAVALAAILAGTTAILVLRRRGGLAGLAAILLAVTAAWFAGAYFLAAPAGRWLAAPALGLLTIVLLSNPIRPDRFLAVVLAGACADTAWAGLTARAGVVVPALAAAAELLILVGPILWVAARWRLSRPGRGAVILGVAAGLLAALAAIIDPVAADHVLRHLFAIGSAGLPTAVTLPLFAVTLAAVVIAARSFPAGTALVTFLLAVESPVTAVVAALAAAGAEINRATHTEP